MIHVVKDFLEKSGFGHCSCWRLGHSHYDNVVTVWRNSEAILDEDAIDIIFDNGNSEMRVWRNTIIYDANNVKKLSNIAEPTVFYMSDPNFLDDLVEFLRELIC